MRKPAFRGAGRRPQPAPATRAAAASYSQQWGVFLAVLCGCLGGLLFTRWAPSSASLERVVVSNRAAPSLRTPGAAAALRFIEEAPLQLGQEQPEALAPAEGSAGAPAAAAPVAQALPPPQPPLQAPPLPPAAPPAAALPPQPGPPPAVAVAAAAAAAAAVSGECASRQAHITAHRAMLASLGLPNAAQGPRGTPACASSSATHLTYMEGYRQVVPEAGELLAQVQELAINFGLTTGTVVLAGMEPASALSAEVSSIERSFARAVHAQAPGELAALLPTLPGPALFVLGTWRADKCTPSLTLARLQAIFAPGAWAHAAGSVLLFPRANGYFGVESPECAGPGMRCDPTALELQAVLCALAPGMNQGMWRGTMRLYPEVAAPWAVRVPVAIPPANLWRKFTLETCTPGEACEGEARGVGIGSFYIQVRVGGRGGGRGGLACCCCLLLPCAPPRTAPSPPQAHWPALPAATRAHTHTRTRTPRAGERGHCAGRRHWPAHHCAALWHCRVRGARGVVGGEDCGL
jgi:hypothetical protein